MNVIDEQKDFYQGIKDTIISGLDYGWFDEHVAQRIARCYGLTRESILKYDAEEMGSYDECSPTAIDNVFGEESEYPYWRD